MNSPRLCAIIEASSARSTGSCAFFRYSLISSLISQCRQSDMTAPGGPSDRVYHDVRLRHMPGPLAPWPGRGYPADETPHAPRQSGAARRCRSGGAIMITRRRFLANSSTFAIATLGAAEALAQGGGLAQSGLVGTLEGSQVVTDPAAIPKSFKEAPELAELVKQGKLPPVAQRLPAEPLVLKPLEAGRPLRRHLAARLRRAGRRRERQPHQRLRQAAVLGLHRQQDHPVDRQERRDERRRQDHARHAARGHEMVGRRAVHGG